MPGRVLVLGNASVDLLLTLPHLARPGETVVGIGGQRAPGGKGLNQAVMGARTGAEVLFCAPLGADEAGSFVEAALRREPLGMLLPRPGPPTDLSVLMVAPDGENCIASTGDCAASLPEAVAEAFAAGAGPGDILLLQGNLSLAATLAGARAARGRGARVLLNTAPVLWPVQAVLAECWAVVANAGEAERITEVTGGLAAQALAMLGPALAIVTLGAAGCVLSPGGPMPAPPVTAVDTTGAGDAFCGVLAAALAHGLGIPLAVAAAQRAAADTVTRRGAFAALPAAFAL